MLPNALKETQASAFQFSGELDLALCVIGVTQLTTKGVAGRYECSAGGTLRLVEAGKFGARYIYPEH
jgi:hypothetical protein